MSISLPGADASVPSKPATLSRRGVALLGFATESSFGGRIDWSMVRTGQLLRARGIPSRLFQVHFHPRDEAQNARRVDELVAKVVDGGYRWAVCGSLWTRELGDRLIAAGVGLVEQRDQSHPDSIHSLSLEELPLAECEGPAPLDPTEGLVELVGIASDVRIAHVDLSVGRCGYQRSLAANPFYADLADDPAFASHRGCAHCTSALGGTAGDASADLADEIIREVRDRRALLPDLETI
jgi:hypothetical protein